MGIRTFDGITAAIVVCSVVSVQAGPIIQDQHGFGTQILSYSPTGQTFTAEDERIISIGFGIFAMNPQVFPAPITVELFEGIGMGGASLGVVPLVDVEPGSEFLDADFSSVRLTIGEIYTALLATTNARAAVWGEWWVSDVDGHVLQPDTYPGGEGFNNQSQYNSGEFDLMFRVLSIPEPATLLLLALGGFGLMRRRGR